MEKSNQLPKTEDCLAEGRPVDLWYYRDERPSRSALLQLFASYRSPIESRAEGSSSGHLRSHPANRKTNERVGRLQVQLSLHLCALSRDLAGRCAPLAGDFLVAIALAKGFEDFQLLVGELVQRAGLRLGGLIDRSLRGAPHHFFAHVDMSIQDVTNGMDDLLWIFLLHDVAVAPGAQHASGVERLVVHGDDQQLDLLIRDSNLFDQFQPAFSGQTDVHQHQVRSEAGDRPQGFGRVAGLATDGQVLLLVEDLDQAFPKARMIPDW